MHFFHIIKFQGITFSTKLKFYLVLLSVNVIFNWAIFALIIFGIAIAYDPLGRTKFNRRSRDTNDNNENNGPNEQTFHKKVAKLWFRRIKWAFCCLRKDEFGQEAFTQVAALLSALFRGTDLVPSDVIAGCILLRVRQKRENREMRRIRMLNDEGPRYSTDFSRVFATSPSWMTLKNAHHFLRFALGELEKNQFQFLSFFLCLLDRLIAFYIYAYVINYIFNYFLKGH